MMGVERSAKQILMHGLAMILAGLLWGIVIPMTPHPRLALGAHIQFESNGMLFVIIAFLLLKLPHRVGTKSALVMVLSVWCTWLMAASEAANAWWGTNQMLPIAAAQAGAGGGAAWQEMIIKLTHLFAALGLIFSVTLLIIGLGRSSLPAALVAERIAEKIEVDAESMQDA